MSDALSEPSLSCTTSEGGVAHVRPAGGWFTFARLAEAEVMFAALQADSAVRAVIVEGDGSEFWGDFDPAEVDRLTPLEAKRLAQRGHRLTEMIEDLGKPVIAALNGPAIGCGAEIALACTTRLAAKTAWWNFPSVAVGRLPALGATQRLARLIGRGRALDFLLSGQVIAAAEAHRSGLVNQLYPSIEALARAAEALANHLAAHDPRIVRYCLEAVRHGLEMPQHEGLMLEANLFGLGFAERKDEF